MHLLTPSENERYGIAQFKREPGEIVASRTSVRVCLHIRLWQEQAQQKTLKKLHTTQKQIRDCWAPEVKTNPTLSYRDAEKVTIHF